ncbi:MAG TPA: hypothetical protein VN660_06660 [Steroidobacteraceae bacterium]|nr:hypothetical protein [Steroidobacteraceae bacterium]
MKRTGIFRPAFVLALWTATSLMAGCVFATPGDESYSEGYYDSPHHRWYHDHRWVACGRDDVHCGRRRDRDDRDDFRRR